MRKRAVAAMTATICWGGCWITTGGLAAATTAPPGTAPTAPEPPSEDATVVANQVLEASGDALVWTVDFALAQPDEPTRVETGDSATALVVLAGQAVASMSDDSRALLTFTQAVAAPADHELELWGDPVGGANFLTISPVDEPGDRETVGQPFELAKGEYDFEVLADTVHPGEQVAIEASPNGPTLLISVKGTLSLTGADTDVLAPGENTTAPGDVQLANDGPDDAVLLAARIAEPLPELTPTTHPAATTATTVGASTTTTATTIDPALDSDGDKVADVDEIADGTDPHDPDTDDDGLNDWDEIRYAGDPHNPDTDGDGITDGDEVNLYGTEPSMADSDGDGHDDFAEIDSGTDPTDPGDHPGLLDPDGDGYNNDEEAAAGTDPFDSGSNPYVEADDDGDGITNVVEIDSGSNPSDPSSTPDSDDDGDGFSNVDEILNGGDPTDPNVHP